MKTVRTDLVTLLRSPKAPWVAVMSSAECPLVSALQSCLPGFHIGAVDGERCKTKAALLAEFAARLHFPEYFGHNWDAFDECIRDLDWIHATGYVIVATHAEALLVESPADYTTFVDVMNSAGEEWASPRFQDAEPAGVPFHVLLSAARESLNSRNWLVPRLETTSSMT